VKKLTFETKNKLEDLTTEIEKNLLFKKYKEFKEHFHYTNNILTLYEVYDDPNLTVHSDWRYTKEGISPKIQAIS